VQGFRSANLQFPVFTTRSGPPSTVGNGSNWRVGGGLSEWSLPARSPFQHVGNPTRDQATCAFQTRREPKAALLAAANASAAPLIVERRFRMIGRSNRLRPGGARSG